MEIYCYGTARVRHAVTGEVYHFGRRSYRARRRRRRTQWAQPSTYEALAEHPELGLYELGGMGIPRRRRNMTESKGRSAHWSRISTSVYNTKNLNSTTGWSTSPPTALPFISDPQARKPSSCSTIEALYMDLQHQPDALHSTDRGS